MTIRLIITQILILFLVCCSNHQIDERLTQVEKTTSSDPQKALKTLYKINRNSLSDEDKQYYDFLLIKTRDKAFITHTSDSLILKIIDNEAKHKSRSLYAEALYYGGRVYHDLGDLPTALNYYHSALDNNPSKSLEGSILSQISGILNSLRLYKQAKPYLQRVIAIDSLLNDSKNLMYDIELLGSVNLNLKKYDKAETLFNRAKRMAKVLAPEDTARQNMYLAAIKYNKDEINPALTLIRPVVQQIDSISRNLALAYACDIYRKASITDTAFLYARELINSKTTNNRRIGYHVILSDEMRKYIPDDSIAHYALEYAAITETNLNQNSNQEALMQTSFYNYQIHQRERIKAELTTEKLHKYITLILLVTLVLFVGLLYLKNRNKTHLLQLHEAINNINELRKEITNSHINGEQLKSEYMQSTNVNPQNIHELKIRFREELLSIRNNRKLSYDVPPPILESETYEQIMQHIDNAQVIPEKSPIWTNLENIIIKSSPNFKYRLRLLTGGNLKRSDFRLALLIKCNISPTNISILEGRAKATISYQRKNLCQKVFDQDLNADVIDDIIRLL